MNKPDIKLAKQINTASLLIAALLMAVFIADTTTDLEIAIAVFYVVPILLSARALSRRGVMALALGCVLLTAVSSFLTAHGAWKAGLIN